jgi:hypothetical protein
MVVLLAVVVGDDAEADRKARAGLRQCVEAGPKRMRVLARIHAITEIPALDRLKI